MDQQQQRRIKYICLIGLAAIVPLVINPEYGGLMSLAGVVVVVLYIRSETKMLNSTPGFPVIPEKESDGSSHPEPSEENSD